VDDLLARGYTSLAVLDISATALKAAQTRLGGLADRVRWLEGAITTVALPEHAYDVWHDRAVFHFLTAAEQRSAYEPAQCRQYVQQFRKPPWPTQLVIIG
jgi:hypothetical protein